MWLPSQSFTFTGGPTSVGGAGSTTGVSGWTDVVGSTWSLNASNYIRTPDLTFQVINDLVAPSASSDMEIVCVIKTTGLGAGYGGPIVRRQAGGNHDKYFLQFGSTSGSVGATLFRTNDASATVTLGSFAGFPDSVVADRWKLTLRAVGLAPTVLTWSMESLDHPEYVYCSAQISNNNAAQNATYGGWGFLCDVATAAGDFVIQSVSVNADNGVPYNFDRGQHDPMLDAMIRYTFTHNLRAASGSMTLPWINGADLYGEAQYPLDTSFDATAAAGTNATLAALAQNWIENYTTNGVDSNGFAANYLQTTGPSSNGFTQCPFLAWAAWNVYQVTGDAVWLARVQAKLELIDAWWIANRMDANGLVVIKGGGEGFGDSIGLYNVEMPSFLGIYNTNATLSGNYDHVDPVVTSALILHRNSLGNIAAALGNSTSAATWRASAVALKNKLNAYCWDDQQHRYQCIASSELNFALGTMHAAGVAGDMTISVSVTADAILHDGCKIVLPNDVVAQASGVYRLTNGQTATITLVAPLTGAVANAAAVITRSICYVTGTLYQTMPMWAGAASYVQASQIVSEYISKTLTAADSETFTILLSTNAALYATAGYLTRFKYVTWRLYGTAPITAPGATIVNSAGTYMDLIYRCADPVLANDPSNATGATLATYNTYNLTDETVGATHPITVTVEWQKTANSAPVVTIKKNNADSFGTITSATLSAAGSVGDWVSATLSYSSTDVTLGKVTIASSNGGANLIIRRVDISYCPTGFLMRAPTGILTAPRFGTYSYALTLAVGRGNAVYSSSSTLATKDYSMGDDYMPNDMIAVQAIQQYGLFGYAAALGGDVLERAQTQAATTGDLPERYSMFGNAKGGVSVPWSTTINVISDNLGDANQQSIRAIDRLTQRIGPLRQLHSMIRGPL